MKKSYEINSMTFEQFQDLIASGDDRHDNQIRVTKDGVVFLSEVTGADQLDDIAFRFETFDAGNDYVGKAASEDEDFLKPIFNALKVNWTRGCKKTYIDDWKFGDY